MFFNCPWATNHVECNNENIQQVSRLALRHVQNIITIFYHKLYSINSILYNKGVLQISRHEYIANSAFSSIIFFRAIENDIFKISPFRSYKNWDLVIPKTDRHLIPIFKKFQLIFLSFPKRLYCSWITDFAVYEGVSSCMKMILSGHTHYSSAGMIWLHKRLS